MRKLFLVGLFLLLGFNQAFATAVRTEFHNLTVSGVPINATTIGAGNTITSDSVYQSGSEASDPDAIAVQIVSGGNVLVNIQLSYDNINWFNPSTSNGQGSITSAATIDSGVTTNGWFIYSNTISPYVRFKFTSTGSSIITAESLWQDWS